MSLWFVDAGEGVVAAERHYDPMRAQLSAAAGVGGVTALVSWGVAPLLGLQAPALLSAESAFWSFLIAASAGSTSLFTHVLRPCVLTTHKWLLLLCLHSFLALLIVLANG